MPTASQKATWKRALGNRLGLERVQLDVPLAPYTTFKIGGPADLFFRARTPDDLVDAVRAARDLEIPFFLLGMGANILVADAGFRGLVVRSEVGGIEFLSRNRVRAGAGVRVYPDLIRATVDRGFGGLHHFVGIPSTVGGAMWQNLHFLSPAPDRERTVFIEEVVDAATLFSADHRRIEVGRDYFRFGYDFSILHERPDVVLGVTFLLSEDEPETLHGVMDENLRWRAQRHPDLQRLPSAGSIFKKIEGIGAGRLIDQCGLKGERRGGAQIFSTHANIIVNQGGATAIDVLSLIELARETVHRETGHLLVPEITLVGSF
jgi:UDP-N-acetylmuramate dehydrogenase